MSTTGAPLPEAMRKDFEKYRAWFSSGEVEEIDTEDSEDDIQRARDTDPNHVATLKYLGLDKHPTWIVKGFEEPDDDTVERWFINSGPWPFQDTGTSLDMMVPADYLGNCTLCNPRDDDSADEDCPECEGEGSTQYWFEDFDENMFRRS